ncbi:unnamed protein product [Dovyalis caffra]|uniref:Uncharacterized protein n=1 Tax=Dovyalis caffra TaxID=77055 RepID=A0AAV1SIF0_9ROSI|nr:unnamed protein product [Dovyalis caffra]
MQVWMQQHMIQLLDGSLKEDRVYKNKEEKVDEEVWMFDYTKELDEAIVQEPRRALKFHEMLLKMG